MNWNRGRKLFGMMCVCSALAAGSFQPALAGPSTGLEYEMVALVEADDVSIYADDDESSAVVAMAQPGGSYDVVEKSGDDWVKVAAGELEGYLKLQGEVMLTRAEEAAAAAEVFMAEQQNRSLKEQVVDFALSFVGGRYQYGGSDPHTGVDCSGFTRYVMQHGAGVSLNRSSSSQATQGQAISAEQMQPGDLIFYGNGSRINHVAMYIGDGQIVHASTEKTGIKTSVWNYRNPVKIINVLG